MNKIAISYGAVHRATTNRFARVFADKKFGKQFIAEADSGMYNIFDMKAPLSKANRKIAAKLIDDLRLLKGKKLETNEGVELISQIIKKKDRFIMHPLLRSKLAPARTPAPAPAPVPARTPVPAPVPARTPVPAPARTSKKSNSKSGSEKTRKQTPYWNNLSTPAKIGIGAGVIGAGTLPFTIPAIAGIGSDIEKTSTLKINLNKIAQEVYMKKVAKFKFPDSMVIPTIISALSVPGLAIAGAGAASDAYKADSGNGLKSGAAGLGVGTTGAIVGGLGGLLATSPFVRTGPEMGRSILGAGIGSIGGALIARHIAKKIKESKLNKTAEASPDTLRNIGIAGAGYIGGNIGHNVGGQIYGNIYPRLGSRRGIETPKSFLTRSTPARLVGAGIGMAGLAGLAHLLFKRPEIKVIDQEGGSMGSIPGSKFNATNLAPIAGISLGSILGRYSAAKKHSSSPLSIGASGIVGGTMGFAAGIVAKSIIDKVRQKRQMRAQTMADVGAMPNQAWMR